MAQCMGLSTPSNYASGIHISAPPSYMAGGTWLYYSLDDIFVKFPLFGCRDAAAIHYTQSTRFGGERRIQSPIHQH